MKQRLNSDIAPFEDLARENTSLKWYAIADSAQSKLLPAALVKPGCRARCLFGASQQSPTAEYAPHLIELAPPLEADRSWKWISENAKKRPCVSIIASEENFDTVCGQLVNCIEVELPDGEMMFFAFWDPAVLGTLVGQLDDFTLHVKGPVLTAEQKASLLGNVTQWWYWDRNRLLHRISNEKFDGSRSGTPFKLKQSQVDDLVEASVPDHVLYYLELNQPLLIDKIPQESRYSFVRESLVKARDIGLCEMGDMVNFACVQIIYGERIEEDFIRGLLDAVKNKKIQFRNAVGQLP